MGDISEAPQFPGDGPTPLLSDEAPIQAQKYQYDSLPKGKYIRMLNLYPGQRHDPLKGRLEVFEVGPAVPLEGVDSPLVLKSYEPLSYVWGPPPSNDDHQITVSAGKKSGNLRLTASLHAALKRLRYTDRERCLWADQICINQEDLVERGQQVQFMNIIYKYASHVLVWLGQDEKNPAGESVAESAFKLVRALDETFRDKEKSEKFHAEHFTEEALDQKSREPWVALDQLTDLPWFARGWIVQEIGTKAPATLFWGEAEIDWMILHGVCEKLTDYHHLRKRFDIRTSQIKYVFERFVESPKDSYHANRFDFIYELHRARGLKVTNQRDRVFAMLGHYSVSGRNFKGILNEELAAMKADYTKTPAQVYTDVAERALTGDKSSLLALAAVQHLRLPPEKKAQQEAEDEVPPSWVPDWRTYQSFILSEPINPHRAHGTTLSDLSVDETKLILSIHGVKVDVVEACSQPLEAKAFHLKSSSSPQPELAIQSLWREICLKDHFNLEDRYLNGEPAFFAYMQTLANGCVQSATRDNRPYNQSFKDECLVKEAIYIEKALGSGAISPSLYDMARKIKTKDEWSRAANGASTNRIFARTNKGYYVLGPKVMDVGDVVCVLFGGKMPFVLRPWGDHFLLVGECYVHGLMNGEAIDLLEQKVLAEEVFHLV